MKFFVFLQSDFSFKHANNPVHKKSLFCLWAVSVLWIMIGSLVNFHQHKIWGKPLLPQFMTTKRDKEDSFVLHKLVNKDITHDSSGISGILSHNENTLQSFYLQLLSKSGDPIIIPVICFTSPGLRAPPVS